MIFSTEHNRGIDTDICRLILSHLKGNKHENENAYVSLKISDFFIGRPLCTDIYS